jgi:3,4-dihydroxy 2-butanone 4-phosphate synthase/GTP cyclohydrolase II
MQRSDISPIEQIIDAARNGRMFILVDNEDRENEGDLIIPAQMATPDAINFMARYGRGLICLALTNARADALHLEPMSPKNRSPHRTAFTTSIEAREGVTTGISAADRARTVAVAIHADNGPESIVTPGHVFPLVARDGGVLVRAGHTEASVDIARLAGLNPSAVICEIMNEDGTMARMDDLVPFAKQHGLKIGTIQDLIAYRRKHDHLVECVAETRFHSPFGGHWIAKTYATKVDYGEHLVLIKGKITPEVPTLVRVHVLSTFTDTLGETESGRAGRLQAAMTQIGDAGSGVIVLIRDGRINALSTQMKRYVQGEGLELRDYGIGAQILADLGIHDMILITNSHRPIVGLQGYGLTVVGERPITTPSGGRGMADILEPAAPAKQAKRMPAQ